MLANFMIVGILLALGREHGRRSARRRFIGSALGGDCAGRAGSFGGGQGRVGATGPGGCHGGEGTLVLQADGGRRYVYNPRLIGAARTLTARDNLRSRGLPLATSDWAELEKHRAQYKELGIDIDRHAIGPMLAFIRFGALTFHLLGDMRTRANWSAPNSSLVERDRPCGFKGTMTARASSK